MKNSLLIMTVLIAVIALFPTQLQFAQDVKPVEDKKETQPDAEKYTLIIEHKKGDIFERTINVAMKGESNEEPDENFDGSLSFKIKVTIIDVKEGAPTHFRMDILDSKMIGTLPGNDSEAADDVKAYSGTWLEYKMNKEGKFERSKTSENYPDMEQEDDIFNNESSIQMLFDNIEIPSKPIALKEEFKFDYKQLLLVKEISNPVAQLFDLREKKEDFKLKIEKISEKAGAKIAHLTGEMNMNQNYFGMNIKINLNVNIDIDITNNRCLKNILKMDFTMDGTDPDTGDEMNILAKIEFAFGNKYSKKENKSEIKPKGGDE